MICCKACVHGRARRACTDTGTGTVTSRRTGTGTHTARAETHKCRRRHAESALQTQQTRHTQPRQMHWVTHRVTHTTQADSDAEPDTEAADERCTSRRRRMQTQTYADADICRCSRCSRRSKCSRCSNRSRCSKHSRYSKRSCSIQRLHVQPAHVSHT